MGLLLDTHVLLWAIYEPARIPRDRRETIAAHPGPVYYSSISLVEIAIKGSRLQADFPYLAQQVRELAERTRFVELPLSCAHAVQLARLPHHHRDPFDRLLVAQAQVETVRLLTADPVLARYSELVECF